VARVPLADVRIDNRPEGAVLSVRGEIDLSNTAAMRTEIIAAVPRDSPGAVIDLTDTSYLDSSGIRLLFDVAERLRARRQRLALVATEAAVVRRVLVLTKLEDAVPVHGDLSDALASLQS
jgi:anti-sigma B factor antagonist/stage II sporulation protein AA (anti-sigma F factor antagonist)